jgi:hypothetical protein
MEDRGGRKQQASYLATPSDVASLPRAVERPALVSESFRWRVGSIDVLARKGVDLWSHINLFTSFKWLVGSPQRLVCGHWLTSDS